MGDVVSEYLSEVKQRRLEEAQAEIAKLRAQVDQERTGKMIAIAAARAGMRHDSIPDAVYRATHNVIWREHNGRLIRHGADGTPELSGSDNSYVTIHDVIEGYRRDLDHYWPDDAQQPAPITSPTNSGKPPMNPKPPTSVADSYGNPNPWAPQTFNLTLQSKIYEADPDRAFKLATAVGKPVIPGGKVGVMP